MTDPQPTDETLNLTISRAAESWADQDLSAIVAGLRAQRDRWNLEQAKGSRKRVTSNKIKPAKSEVKRLAAGLKKLTL